MAIYYGRNIYSPSFYHYGIKGQKWGNRRYQNEDGSLTEAGRLRYTKTSEDSLEGRRHDYPIGKPLILWAETAYKHDEGRHSIAGEFFGNRETVGKWTIPVGEWTVKDKKLQKKLFVRDVARNVAYKGKEFITKWMNGSTEEKEYRKRLNAMVAPHRRKLFVKNASRNVMNKGKEFITKWMSGSKKKK